MGRKPKFEPKKFESINKGRPFKDHKGKNVADTSANIYESMLRSQAFKDLNTKSKMLYVYCKSQYYGKRKPRVDYPLISVFNDDSCFYLSWRDIQNYGLYTDTQHSNFYKDMKVLIEHGFIERVASGRTNRTKTIYRFSARWIEWRQ